MPDLTKLREQIAGLSMTLATIRDIIEETIEVDKPATSPLGHTLRRIHRLTERDPQTAAALAIIDAAIGEEVKKPAPVPTIHGRTYKIDGYIEGDRFYVQSTPSPFYINCLDAEGWWVHAVSKWALFPTEEAAEEFARLHTDRVTESMPTEAMPSSIVNDPADGGYASKFQQWREWNACKVCGNMPDEDGCIEHGRGCYTQSEDGGGISYADDDPPEKPTEAKGE
jgi:hypothetical protein